MALKSAQLRVSVLVVEMPSCLLQEEDDHVVDDDGN